LIGGLESVLSIAAVDQLTDVRSDPDRELMALGVTNIVTGLFGGLFMVYLRLRATATFNGGGRGWRAVLAGCAMLALVFTAGLPLVQRLPTAVVAGIVVMLAWTLVDRWTRQLVRQWWRGERSLDLTLSLLIVLVVCVVTLRWGFVVGVAAGVLAAMLIFVRSLNRSLLRSRYRASDIPSRRIYPPALEMSLARQRDRIEVMELEGALFFGNAERLVDEVERIHLPGAGPATRHHARRDRRGGARATGRTPGAPRDCVVAGRRDAGQPARPRAARAGRAARRRTMVGPCRRRPCRRGGRGAIAGCGRAAAARAGAAARAVRAVRRPGCCAARSLARMSANASTGAR
jgi:hypothetical protein